MKLKTTVIAAAVLSLTSITATQAAVELTPKQATELKPYERITVTGRFNAIYEASDAVSRRADKMGAYAFYIQSLDDVGDSGNMRVVADVYAKDAPEVGTPKRRVFGGLPLGYITKRQHCPLPDGNSEFFLVLRIKKSRWGSG